MIYIQIDYQKAHDYFEDRLCAYNMDVIEKLDDDRQREIEDEIELWFDRWINWVAGTPLLDGTNIAYLYGYSGTAVTRLDDFDIEYRLIDDEGNEAEAPYEWIEANPLVTCTEMAAQHNIPVRTLQRACAQGDIPARKVGRTWLFKVSEFERWQGNRGK